MEEKIIQDYLNGESISKLLTKYPYNRRQITKFLVDNGVAIRGGRNKKLLTDEQVEKVKNMINDGATITDIAKYCNLDLETTKKRIKELGLIIKSTKRTINKRLIEDYFSIIDSKEKAYWLGFLFTDGCVDHYKKGRIRLQLQETDIEILEKFKEDLKLDCKIIYDIRPNSTCCSVEFTSEKMFNDLNKYGIIPNKTYKMERIPFDTIPKEFLSSYVLGLYDGDGGLSYSKNFSTDVTLGYTAYHETEVQDFQYLINTLVGIEKNNKNFFTSAWHTQWRGRLQVLKILDVLYKDNPRFLKRKYDKYLALKNSLK